MIDKNTRTSEILINDEWQSISPINIKKDMTFRLFEEDGTPVKWKNISSWMALGDAYYMDNGVIAVDTNR